MIKSTINYNFDNHIAILVWHHDSTHDHKYCDNLLQNLHDTAVLTTKLLYGYSVSTRFSINHIMKNQVQYRSFTLHTKQNDYTLADDKNVDESITFIKRLIYQMEILTLQLILKRPYYEMNLPKPLIRFILKYFE